MKPDDLDVQNEQKLDVLRQFAESNPAAIISLLDAIPIGICITDENGYFKNVNRVYCNFYGYHREELIGNSFTMVVPEPYREQLQELHDQFMGKRYELQGNWEVVDKNGHRRRVLSNAAYLPATGTEGPRKMTFIVEASPTDETLNGLQETVALLENKISAQDAALQLSNHDLRNNLASILQMVELLLDKQPTEEQRVWLNYLKLRSGDTLDLLTASLDYAKMEQGSYKREEKEFDLVKAIREELESMSQIIRRKSIQVQLLYRERAVGNEEIIVEADKFYLVRMLHNLLLNALEASLEEQTVNVTLDHNGFFKITIHNQGVIPEDIRNHFFDKFATSGKNKGTGLGTYIAKLVVEMHEGSIAYHSSKEEGTKIIILFPRRILRQ